MKFIFKISVKNYRKLLKHKYTYPNYEYIYDFLDIYVTVFKLLKEHSSNISTLLYDKPVLRLK